MAGVPALILRIGFVGELGYEIHCPAAAGDAPWDAILGDGSVAISHSAWSPSASCACRSCT